METAQNLSLADLPLPIRTPRLLIRLKQSGDNAPTIAAVAETWSDLHQWMQWAENRGDITEEQQESRRRQQLQRFHYEGECDLLGIETATAQPVVWCGFHGIDWNARQCDTGFWVRKSAQGRGFATEATNAQLRFAFGALGMRRVGITHSGGNDASRRIVEKLGFVHERIEPGANLLPEGRVADRHCYARHDLTGLPSLDVHWAEARP